MQVRERTDDSAAKRPMQIDSDLLVDQHANYLYHYALTRVRDETIAEDLVQETLLAALAARSDFDRRSSERTWLTSILKHKIFDHYRRSARELPRGENGDDPSDLDQFFRHEQWPDHWSLSLQPHNWKSTPEASLQQKEFFGVLHECLAKLPERFARAFTLHELDGLDCSEICSMLAISPNNYWVIMHRARFLLRRCMEIGWFRKVH